MLRMPQKIDKVFSEWQVESCYVAADMAAFMLLSYGYIVRVVKVWYTIGEIGTHAVCAYEWDGKWWVCANNLRWLPKYSHEASHIPFGPYNHLHEIAQAVAFGDIKKWCWYKVS